MLTDDSVRLNYGARTITFPAFFREALEFALHQPDFVVGDIPGELQDEEKLVFVERLLEEGLLVRKSKRAGWKDNPSSKLAFISRSGKSQARRFCCRRRLAYVGGGLRSVGLTATEKGVEVASESRASCLDSIAALWPAAALAISLMLAGTAHAVEEGANQSTDAAGLRAQETELRASLSKDPEDAATRLKLGRLYIAPRKLSSCD